MRPIDTRLTAYRVQLGAASECGKTGASLA
jgi:hypothetical protein